MSAELSRPAIRPVVGEFGRELGEELRRQDESAFFPFLNRVVEIADLLAEGRRVDPAWIQSAVGLWDRFAREVHAPRVELLERASRSEATLSPPPALTTPRRLRQRTPTPASSEVPGESSPGERMAMIRADQSRMAERSKAFVSLIADYDRQQYWAREMLASLLRSAAFSDRSWAQYEEEFALKFLTPAYPAESEAGLRQELDQLRVRAMPVEADLRTFLATAVPIRPSGAP